MMVGAIEAIETDRQRVMFKKLCETREILDITNSSRRVTLTVGEQVIVTFSRALVLSLDEQSHPSPSVTE